MFGQYEIADDTGRRNIALPPASFNDLAKAMQKIFVIPSLLMKRL